MKNEVVRKNLSAELERLSMTTEEICETLQITKKTLDGYLAGNSIPTRILVTLRFLTGKPVQFLLDLPDYDQLSETQIDIERQDLKPEEIALVAAWRVADERARESVAHALRFTNFSYTSKEN